MLPSSSTTPTEEGLVSSETLTVMTLPVRSPQNVESKDSVTESDIDTEEEECESENDLEILGEQSDTVDVTGNTNSTEDSSGGTETSVKKTKIILTENQQTFVKMFLWYSSP